jgi:hypothetical protein
MDHKLSRWAHGVHAIQGTNGSWSWKSSLCSGFSVSAHRGEQGADRPRLYLLRLVQLGLLGIGGSWWALAIYHAGPRPEELSLALAAGYGLGLVWVSHVLGSGRQGLAGVSLCVVLPLAWWCSIAPRNDRDWEPEVSRLPFIEVQGTRLTVRDVREFSYRAELEVSERWSDRTYDLADLVGLDIFLSYWGSPAVAHTILSWDFGSASPLAISIETRKSRGESYSTLAGFFKQYELIYVAADERDLIGLRTAHRAETVYLYRTRVAAKEARALLLDYGVAMNRLHREPRFYNALLHNCTTTIVMHSRHIGRRQRSLDWRMVLNGFADSLLYERELLDGRLPFEELRRVSRINEKARIADGREGFSRQIREGLPDPR